MMRDYESDYKQGILPPNPVSGTVDCWITTGICIQLFSHGWCYQPEFKQLSFDS